MAEQWYYTSEGKAMEPVTGAELKQLAASGYLKPTDLVWQEGMAKWVRAGSAKGLFPEAGLLAAPAPTPATALPLAEVSEPATALPVAEAVLLPVAERPRRRRRERNYDDDDDDYDRRPRRRRSHGMTTGAKVGIIVGVIALVAVLGGGLLIFLLSLAGDTRSFSLGVDQKTFYNIRFTKGKKVEIWVTSNKDSDVDLFVFDNNRLVAKDDGVGKDCYVWFIPQSTQTYRVEVWNRLTHVPWRNIHNSGTLRFQESNAGAQGPPPVFNPPVRKRFR